MFIEKRKFGKSIKYYLVYSYREDNKIKKIRKYLGENLTREEIKNKQVKARLEIKKEIKKISTKVFDFFLKPSEIKRLNKLNNKIRIVNLNLNEWKKFEKEFVYNTNAIEGSKVLKEEVPKILNKKRVQNLEEKETKNVAKAIEYIHKNKNRQELSLELIKKLHRICFQGTKSFAGKFRDVEVVIKDPEKNIIHAGVPVSEVKIYLKEMVNWYKKNKNKFKPLILAGIIHNQFENIHPFRDGNGRIGRLLLNFILLKNKYPPVNILLEDRGEYYYTLQKYSNNDEIEPTIKFLIKQYNKTLSQVTTKKIK